MRRIEYEGRVRRKILLSMITNDRVCGVVSRVWGSSGLFDADWSNLIGRWCVDHYGQYNKAPGNDIVSVFEEWAQRGNPTEDQISSIERIFAGIGEEQNDTNGSSDDHLIDLAERHFNEIQTRRTLEAAEVAKENGDYEEAQFTIERLRKISLRNGNYVEPLKDFSLWEAALERERKRPLVRYTGAAGDFFSESFCRGEFYSFVAPDKTGKTTYLIDFTYRACRCRNRVAYFECGDGDREEVMLRLSCRAGKAAEFGGTYKYPNGWNDDGSIIIVDRSIPEVNPIRSFKTFERDCKSDDAFRLTSFPNSSISAAGIDDLLEEWSREGWRPDVVVVDYADILAPPRGVNNRIEQIDETWKHLRRITQSRRCLLVTATQTNSSAYTKEVRLIGMHNFSGSKTKNAHVNGMIGINVSEEERSNGCGRLNWCPKRKDRIKKPRNYVTVAGCFGIENPIIISRW